MAVQESYLILILLAFKLLRIMLWTLYHDVHHLKLQSMR